MPVRNLALADPEVAAGVFKAHLDALWSTGRPGRLGWVRRDLTNPLHTLISLPATRPSGERDAYHFRLGAEYYDAAAPTVSLVAEDGVTHPPKSSKWFPTLQPPGWFGLHEEYTWPDGSKRQLVCFTLAAQYYMTDHSPTASQEWKQGRHTVAATLYRLAEVLSPAHYRGPGA